MKTRSDFVTNSSSSNMILALKQPLSSRALHLILMDMKKNNPEAFAKLPIEVTGEFAISLTGLACGNTMEKFFKWVDEWGYRHESLVKNPRQSLLQGGGTQNFGEFPTYAINLRKEGYQHVYMLDINDFSGIDDIMSRLCKWAGLVKTDNFMLKVESY